MKKLIPPPKRKRRPRGFTLIETMVSGVIGLTLFGTAVMSFNAVNGVQTLTRKKTVAFSIAENALEEVLLLYPGDPDLRSGTRGPTYFDFEGHPTLTASSSGYSVYITSVANAPIDDMRRITARVEWQHLTNTGGGATTTKAVELTTDRR